MNHIYLFFSPKFDTKHGSLMLFKDIDRCAPFCMLLLYHQSRMGHNQQASHT